MAKQLCPEPMEAEEQEAVFRWAAFIPELSLLFAIPNGGSRNAIEAKHLKAQGVKAGVPDMCLPVPSAGYHGLFVEMKRRNHGRVSGQQAYWLEQLTLKGYACAVCHGAAEAMELLTAYITADEEKLRHYTETD